MFVKTRLCHSLTGCGSVILLLWALLFQTLSDSLGCIRDSEITQLVRGSTAATWTSRKDTGESGTDREGQVKVGGVLNPAYLYSSLTRFICCVNLRFYLKKEA